MAISPSKHAAIPLADGGPLCFLHFSSRSLHAGTGFLDERFCRGVLALIRRWTTYYTAPEGLYGFKPFSDEDYFDISLAYPFAEEVTANSVTVIGAMVLLERLLRKLPPRQKMTVQSQTVMFMCCLAVYHKQTVDIHYNSKSFAIFAGQPPSRFYKQELLALSILDFDTAVGDSELSAMFNEIINSS